VIQHAGVSLAVLTVKVGGVDNSLKPSGHLVCGLYSTGIFLWLKLKTFEKLTPRGACHLSKGISTDVPWHMNGFLKNPLLSQYAERRLPWTIIAKRFNYNSLISVSRLLWLTKCLAFRTNAHQRSNWRIHNLILNFNKEIRKVLRDYHSWQGYVVILWKYSL
jgi:hypothetical protein